MVIRRPALARCRELRNTVIVLEPAMEKSDVVHVQLWGVTVSVRKHHLFIAWSRAKEEKYIQAAKMLFENTFSPNEMMNCSATGRKGNKRSQVKSILCPIKLLILKRKNMVSFDKFGRTTELTTALSFPQE